LSPSDTLNDSPTRDISTPCQKLIAIEDPANFASVWQPTDKVLAIVEQAPIPRALDKTVSFLARAIRRKDRGDSTLRVEFQLHFGTFCAKAKADRIRPW